MRRAQGARVPRREGPRQDEVSLLIVDPQAATVVHGAFEALAFFTGMRVYLRLRRPERLDASQTMSVLLGAAAGAMLGSKLVAFAQTGALGQSIVGGLLGGWAGVELAKRLGGVKASTGDDIVVPLCAGIAIGRLGCFLTGPADGTWGSEPAAWWGPLPLYEAAFVVALSRAVPQLKLREGEKFQALLGAYLAFRVLVDFLKPYPRVAGLSVTQWAALVGLGALAAVRARRLTETPCPSDPIPSSS